MGFVCDAKVKKKPIFKKNFHSSVTNFLHIRPTCKLRTINDNYKHKTHKQNEKIICICCYDGTLLNHSFRLLLQLRL